MADSRMISQATRADDRDTHLHGRLLLLARVTWFVVVGLIVALFVVSIPLQIAASQIICNSPVVNDCFNLGQLTPQLLQELEQMGLSISFYVGYNTVVQVAFPLVFLAVGALVFWRRSDDWMALLVSLLLVVFGLASFASSPKLLPLAYPILTLPSLFFQFLGVALLMFFFFLFPDGHFVPRWILWLMPFILLREGINSFMPNSDLANSGAWFVLQLIEVAIALYAQIYRYRRVSGPVQRQQTKWVVYGLAMALVGYFGFILLFGIGFAGWTTNVLAVLLLETALPSFLLLIPLSILVAILRYRLYEIDLLINRTLVYIPLTAILAGIFAASISVTQRFFIAITGQTSDAATVLTTLIVVAAFTPIKDRLQAVVEKRFKEAPDPAKKLKALGDQVRARMFTVDPRQATRRLLEQAVRAFEAMGGVALLESASQKGASYTFGEWNGVAMLNAPLEINGARFGTISLGPRRTGADYSARDREALCQIATVVAQAIAQDQSNDGREPHSESRA